MDIDEVLARIKVRLQKRGLTETEASRNAGLPIDALRNLRRSRTKSRSPQGSIKTLAAVAPILGTSLQWLTDGTGAEEGGTFRITISGCIAANGAVLFPPESGGITVDAPAWANKSTIAVVAVDGGMGPLFDGWIVFFQNDRTPPTPELIGKLCVVGLPDGAILLRRLEQAAGGGYHLLSQASAPMLDQQVEWATAVMEIRPPE